MYQPQNKNELIKQEANFFCDIIFVFIYILDAVDPLVLLLRRGGGDAVHHVVPFHYSPISFCLTCLYQLTTVVGDVQLKAVLMEERQKS